MTARIAQQVVPRHRAASSHTLYRGISGHWRTRQIRTRRAWRAYLPAVSQRGSVTQSTVTMGLAILALGIVVLLGFFYLQQVFGTATSGSDIQALEGELNDLREQQRALELESAELRSMQAVEERVKHINLVTIDQVAYLADTPGKVAQAR